MKMKRGATLIAEERERQISDEGWCDSHDDGHDYGEIIRAALCYAEAALDVLRHNARPVNIAPFLWPWEKKWWKPDHKNAVRNLVKAGALIAAEIDRLQRAEPK